MKRVVSYTILTISFILTNCQGQNKVNDPAYDSLLTNLLDHSVPEITVKEIKQPSQYVFLDSREFNEYNVSHIPNAKWVGYDSFDIGNLKELNKNQKIIIYCSVGYRSEKISETFINHGFTNVKNLYGGVFEWANEGLPLVDSKNSQTTRVHAYNRTWGVWLEKGEKVY